MTRALQLAQQQHRAQARLGAEAARDVAALWRGMIDTDDIDTSWPPLRDLLARIVVEQRATSAEQAVAYYLAAREDAGATGEFTPLPVADISGEVLRTALDVAGKVAFKKAIGAGKFPEGASESALVQLVGAVSRMVRDGGRATIHQAVRHDEQALGYARVTDTDPCAFCAMLASRGPVYSAATAGDPRHGGDRYHDHCACIAMPVFSRDAPWAPRSREFADTWGMVTEGLSGDEARRAWRRHVDARQRDQRRERHTARRQVEHEQAQEAARREAARRADPLADLDLTQLADEQVAALASEHADRPEIFDRLVAEMERRDRIEHPDDEEQGFEVDEPTADEQRVADLVEQGWDYRDAYAEVHGLDPEELEREERAAAVDAQRAEGETRDQAVRRLYDDWVHEQYVAAEDATNGFLLNKTGQSAGVDPRSLFSGPAARARKYASEELKRWWMEHPRMTFGEFKADMLGRESDVRAARRTREGGAGREFGL